jgi:toxin-antitoxin system PIN domain toxin
MPALCDANVLLALVYDRHVHHTAALAWLDTQSRTAVLCRVTQLSLLRLLCHTTVMGADVCTLAGAWSIYDAIQNDERFHFVAEPEPLERVLRRLTQAPTISPKVWTDAYLAAFALSAGLQLVTFDRGFQQFRDLQLILLQG